MKHFALAFFAASLSLSIAKATEGYLDGGEYLILPAEQRTAYIMGLADMMLRMGEAVENSEEKAFLARTNRCSDGMTGVQLRDFIDAYINSDTANRNYGMASNFRAAFNLKCPP